MKKFPEKSITIRTLYRELPRITAAVAKGQRFDVTKHGKPILSLSPIEQQRGARYHLADLTRLQWKGGPKDLSQRIDDIVYGL